MGEGSSPHPQSICVLPQIKFAVITKEYRNNKAMAIIKPQYCIPKSRKVAVTSQKINRRPPISGGTQLGRILYADIEARNRGHDFNLW
tara:strand:- start:672 stop:935 length:264 start_codon:yes stop_codon:yes gene_type:complete